MKVKFTLIFAGSFFAACLFIVSVNVLYMKSSVYADKKLYHYDPSAVVDKIKKEYWLPEGALSKAGEDFLRGEKMGLQLLDGSFREIYSFRVPIEAQKNYTPSSLVNLYEAEGQIVFVKGLEAQNASYTLILFLNPKDFKRILYTYDVQQVGEAYNLHGLIGMNLVVLLMVSIMYTQGMTRPLQKILSRIMALSRGVYSQIAPESGIYKPVEEALNDLSHELETAKQERLALDQSKEEWILNVSHDIKTPLTSMMGYGELLGDGAYDLSPKEREGFKEIILAKGTYIEKLLEDLNFSMRLKQEILPMAIKSVNLVALIKEDLIDIANVANEDFEKHTLEFTYSKDFLEAQVDRHLLKRVLSNLLYNAYKHNEEAVCVRVHLEEKDATWLELTVEDSGIGVPEESLSKLFSRYYRGTHTKAKSEGSGLGMAIVKDIINAHGGRIKASIGTLGGLKITIDLRRTIDEKVH